MNLLLRLLDLLLQSWFVSSHKSLGLPPSHLSSTLALVTTSNSLLAIFAGLLADLLVRGLGLGPLAPFLAAVVSSLEWACY